MAESFQKKESIKKNALRKKIKDQKKQERKVNNNKGKGFDSMVAYELGNLAVATPDKLLIRKSSHAGQNVA